MNRINLSNGLIIIFSSLLIFFSLENLVSSGEPDWGDKASALFILFIPLTAFTIFTLGNLSGFLYFLYLIFINHRFIQTYRTYSFLPLLGITLSVGILSALAERKFLLRIKGYKKNLLNLKEKIDSYVQEREEKTRIQSLLTQRFERFSRLKFMAEEFSTTLEISRIIQSAEERIPEIIPRADNFLIYLLETEKGEMESPRITYFRARVKGGLENKELQLDIFDRWILRSYDKLLISDVKKDFRFSKETVEELQREFRSLLASPLIAKGKILGVVRLESSPPGSFTPDDLRMLDLFSDLLAVGVENAYLYQRTEELAKYDGLTGLFLPRYFYTRWEEIVARFSRISLLMLDLDHFKGYNDRYGHIAGDIMLKKIAQLILNNLSGEDFAVRYGGEEFLLVLLGKGKEEAIALAEEIRGKVAQEVFFLRREATHLTVSIGIVTYPYEGKTREELIHKADAWLYLAKAKGRNRIAYAGIK
ncbi:MAG: sensor domain-containing diguanylate cyclase [Candidatus Omnitrophica bacterium]|nr:sensor domain-containing diguanylate cyclase [Candidatus Omnitrophota bacterium]